MGGMPVLSAGGGAKGLIVGGLESRFRRGFDGVEGDKEVVGPPEELAEGVASGEGGEDVTEGGSRRPKGLETYVIVSPAHTFSIHPVLLHLLIKTFATFDTL
jgi:hypothetical protein